MVRRAVAVVCVIGLCSALGYAAFSQGGGDSEQWYPVLLILATAGIACAISTSGAHGSAGRLTLWGAVALPVYAAFQLLPLPAVVLGLLSSTRAELARSVEAVASTGRFASLSIGPPKTWEHVSRLAGYAIMFLAVRDLSNRSARRQWSLAIPLLLIAGAEAAWGLFGPSDSEEAVSGTFLNHAQFSGLLEMILPFAVLYPLVLLRRTSTSRAAILGACCLFGLAAAIFTGIVVSLSKMGYIAVMGSLLVIGTLFIASRVRGWKKWPALAGLVAVVVSLFLASPTFDLIGAFGTVASDPTGEGRMPIWGDTLRLIAAYPLFGCGLANYFPALLKYQTSGLNVAWVNAHNDYLQLLAELGVAGFLIAAALMSLVFFRAVRSAVAGPDWEKRLLALACTGGIAAALIHSLADFNLYVPADALALAWISGMAASLSGKGGAPKRRLRGDSVPAESTAQQTQSHNWVLLAGSGLGAVYAGASLVFVGLALNLDVKAEPAFCRFGICDTPSLESGLQLLHGAPAASKLPPAEVAELLRRDPAGPYQWEDLGDAFQHAGSLDQARYCYDMAVTLGPRIPEMLFRAANFHFGLGENRAGFALMGRAMQSDVEYQRSGFAAYEERNLAVDDILHYGLPDAAAAQAFLRDLLNDEKASAASRAWAWILAQGWADGKLASEYAASLMRSKDYGAAARAWADYAGERGYLSENCVFNGDFEADSNGSPFDWRLDNGRPGFRIAVDDQVAHSGRRSARVSFDGSQNVEWIDFSQDVFLPVSGRYKFQAWVKMDGITTDQGVSFRVASAETDNMTGATGWLLVAKEFDAPAGMAQVRLFRRKSWKADSLIQGTVWIDGVKIVREGKRAGAWSE